jgi:hypothetical protein
MIDPITAAAAATKAYAGVRAFIEAGKSIEDTFQVVARWQGHASDILYVSQRQKNVQTRLRQLCFLAPLRQRPHRCLPLKSGLKINVKK